MQAVRLTPILNVSDLQASFAWFARLGWTKGFGWGKPESFGSVCSGECEIFLCLDGQGGRGLTGLPMTFGPNSDESQEKGVWVSLWLNPKVDTADSIEQRCREQGIEITWPATDMPWGVRELHVRHPDGHVSALASR